MRKRTVLTFFMIAWNTPWAGLPPAWGFFAHKKINQHAVLSLPEPLYSYYRPHIGYITEHAADADKRRHAVKGEAECHFLDMDHYTDHYDSINKIVPATWEDAVKKFGEDSLRKHGIVPWHTYLVFQRLVRAMENRDGPAILRHSADLGHYVADMHVPLHTTRNYNGQLTGQEGIHGFWESRLPELCFSEYDLVGTKAVYLEKPMETIWRILKESHAAVDSVLQTESNLRKTTANAYTFEESRGGPARKFSRTYSAQYHEALNGMVERRMRQAVERLASLWFTAWVNAGQPNLSTIASEKIKNSGKSVQIPSDSLDSSEGHR